MCLRRRRSRAVNGASGGCILLRRHQRDDVAGEIGSGERGDLGVVICWGDPDYVETRDRQTIRAADDAGRFTGRESTDLGRSWSPSVRRI